MLLAYRVGAPLPARMSLKGGFASKSKVNLPDYAAITLRYWVTTRLAFMPAL